jgi:NAD(P)-dependent dehydrogenase (short-subunit alcohol dehydrogenase family)
MPTLLITGANRGIGLEFTRGYAADGWRVHAACRDPAAARELAAVKGEVSIHALDVADDTAIRALADRLKGEAIDLLINNAGILDDDALGQTDADTWLRAFRINSIAPIHVLEAFLPHLERGRQKTAVALTSKMGSIADNGSGGSYIYRSSKAALNAAMKSAAIDLKSRGIKVAVFHPGWVRTDMGGPNGQIDTRTSVAGLRAKIAGLTPAESGGFFNYDGKALPW